MSSFDKWIFATVKPRFTYAKLKYNTVISFEFTIMQEISNMDTIFMTLIRCTLRNYVPQKTIKIKLTTFKLHIVFIKFGKGDFSIVARQSWLNAWLLPEVSPLLSVVFHFSLWALWKRIHFSLLFENSESHVWVHKNSLAVQEIVSESFI